MAGQTIVQISCRQRLRVRGGLGGPGVLLGVQRQRPAGQQLDDGEQRAGGGDHDGDAVAGVTMVQVSCRRRLRVRGGLDGPGVLLGVQRLRRAGEQLHDAEHRAGGGDHGGDADGGADHGPGQRRRLSACALDSTGLAYCWGDNGYGQLGNNSTTQSSVPVAVTTARGRVAGRTLAQVSAGVLLHVRAGFGGPGVLLGEQRQRPAGQQLHDEQQRAGGGDHGRGADGGRTLTQVSAGGDFACALDSAGAAYCWGYNTTGQLGNNSTAQSNVGVLVAPQAPTGLAASPGDATAAISWTAPVFVNNGTVTGYTVSASPGTATAPPPAPTSCTLTGLTNGTTYTVTVTVTATTGTATSLPVTVGPAAGMLSAAVPPSATLPSATDGNTTSRQLGAVTVTDNRALGSASWTATVSSTAFTTAPEPGS